MKQLQIRGRPLGFGLEQAAAEIVECCMIMHNMVVGHRRKDYTISEWMYTVGQSHVDALNSRLVSLLVLIIRLLIMSMALVPYAQ